MGNYSYSKQSAMYDVDVCMLIDKTGSMRPIIDTVKANADFHAKAGHQERHGCEG